MSEVRILNSEVRMRKPELKEDDRILNSEAGKD